jgi:hypothetical protein
VQLSQKQVQMLEMIEENQRAIAEFMMVLSTQSSRDSREDTNATTHSIRSTSRLLDPTLSSLVKQRRVPSKYMKVSPLRIAYQGRRQSASPLGI